LAIGLVLNPVKLSQEPVNRSRKFIILHLDAGDQGAFDTWLYV
jgi:hypothetical protein